MIRFVLSDKKHWNTSVHFGEYVHLGAVHAKPFDRKYTEYDCLPQQSCSDDLPSGWKAFVDFQKFSFKTFFWIFQK